MPPSIHSLNEASEPFNTATLSSPSRSLSTISCDSIKTIETWLDNVERAEVTVIVEELGKAGPELAQEPEAKNTRKRKHSSSLTEEYLSLSSLRKRSQHLSQLITGYGMADNIIGAGQVYLHTSIAIQALLTNHRCQPPLKVPPWIRLRPPLPTRQNPRLLWTLVGLLVPWTCTALSVTIRRSGNTQNLRR